MQNFDYRSDTPTINNFNSNILQISSYHLHYVAVFASFMPYSNKTVDHHLLLSSKFAKKIHHRLDLTHRKGIRLFSFGKSSFMAYIFSSTSSIVSFGNTQRRSRVQETVGKVETFKQIKLSSSIH